jgi:hypothetical protein
MSGTIGLFRQQERERAGPEALDELFHRQGDAFGHLGDEVELILVRQVDDERIEGRAFLRLEDFRDGGGIERVGGEAIDGFCRESDDFALAEETHGLLDGLMHQIRLIGAENGGDVGHEGVVWLSITAQAL